MLGRLLHRDNPSVGQSVVLEPMRRRHLAAVMTIENGSYPKPWTHGVFTSELEMADDGQRTYLVARRGASLIGYAGSMYVIGDAHVTNIAVAPSQQRNGVGTRLLAELTWEAVRRECTAMTLEVRASNSAAQSMYRRFGFVPAGVRQRYYENVEDAIVMWCNDVGEQAHLERLRALCPEAAR